MMRWCASDVCLSVCLSGTSGPKSRIVRLRGSPRHTWLWHHFQGQKVKDHLAGGGGILRRTPAELVLFISSSAKKSHQPAQSACTSWASLVSRWSRTSWHNNCSILSEPRSNTAFGKRTVHSSTLATGNSLMHSYWHWQRHTWNF